MSKILDLAGQRFGRLTALHRAPSKKQQAYWACRCDCGTVKVARTCALRSGKTQSCGCLQRELAAEQFSTHKMSATPEYGIWLNMRQRCTNPRRKEWPRYGGRGIECRFTSFEQLLAEIGPRPSPRHSVDRINTNGHYEPGNVRWATREQQSRNKRTNRLITHGGQTQCLAAWAEELGLNSRVIYDRLALGWSVERALTTPVSGRLPSSPS
jgi:hypothetical protein